MYSTREWVHKLIDLKVGIGVTLFFIKNKFYVVKYQVFSGIIINSLIFPPLISNLKVCKCECGCLILLIMFLKVYVQLSSAKSFLNALETGFVNLLM